MGSLESLPDEGTAAFSSIVATYGVIPYAFE